MQRYGEASRENHWTGEGEDFFLRDGYRAIGVLGKAGKK
jgi:hypothetical protein